MGNSKNTDRTLVEGKTLSFEKAIAARRERIAPEIQSLRKQNPTAKPSQLLEIWTALFLEDSQELVAEDFRSSAAKYAMGALEIYGIDRVNAEKAKAIHRKYFSIDTAFLNKAQKAGRFVAQNAGLVLEIALAVTSKSKTVNNRVPEKLVKNVAKAQGAIVVAEKVGRRIMDKTTQPATVKAKTVVKGVREILGPPPATWSKSKTQAK